MELFKSMVCTVLLGFTTMILSMENLVDLSTPGEDVVIITTRDNVPFLVDQDVAKQSKTLALLLEDAGVADPIPLENINGRELERFFAVLSTKKVENMSAEELFDLLMVSSYLDSAEAQEIITQSIKDFVYWDVSLLEQLFASPLDPSVKIEVVKALAKKVSMDLSLDMFTEILASEGLSEQAKILILKELIRSHAGLLELFAPGADYSYHIKRLEEQGITGEKVLAKRFMKMILSESLINFYTNLKQILGKRYVVLENALKSEELLPVAHEQYFTPHFKRQNQSC